MKLTLSIPLLASLIGMTGCATLLSTDAFVTQEEAMVDPHLAGTWTKDGDTIVIRLNGRTYNIMYIEDSKEAIGFTGRLVRVGDALPLDVARATDDPFVLALHFAVRVWPEPGSLRWTVVDSDWLRERASELSARHEKDRTIVTGPAGDFLRRFGGDERALGKIETWTRAQ
jgi:hypothetical protein